MLNFHKVFVVDAMRLSFTFIGSSRPLDYLPSTKISNTQLSMVHVVYFYTTLVLVLFCPFPISPPASISMKGAGYFLEDRYTIPIQQTQTLCFA